MFLLADTTQHQSKDKSQIDILLNTQQLRIKMMKLHHISYPTIGNKYFYIKPELAQL